MRVYLLEVGVLLDEDDEEYEFYSQAYDKAHGFYDEGQNYYVSLSKAIRSAKEYVEEGVENTYAIVSETELDYEFTQDELDEDVCVENEEYSLASVVFSVVKENGCLKEGFLNDYVLEEER